jgi:hypothetical protein
MKRHSLKLAFLWNALLGAALAAPAPAQTVNLTQQCAVLVDNTGTVIQIENGGFVPGPHCHNPTLQTICGEGFSACVNNKFALGGFFGILDPMGNPAPAAVYNLLPSITGGPSHLCEPFFIPSPGAEPIFLTPVPATNPPVYNLDAQDLDGDGMFDDSVPLGTLIQVVVDTPPDPDSDNCVGVRTTIQHRVGTCKIWKIRKFYNTCSSKVTLTQIKEFELPCNQGKFAAKAGPGQFLTAVALTNNVGPGTANNFITLQSMGNTGANAGNAKTPAFQRSAAGSVLWLPKSFPEFFSCSLTSGFTSSLVTGQFRWLEVFLSFFPGGVLLKPVAKPGSEKIVTFCIDVE